MADYYYDPVSKTLKNDHPIDVVFHENYFNMLHVCTCAREQDPTAAVEIDRIVQHPDYKIFAEFVPITDVNEIPPEMRAIMMLSGIPVNIS